MLFIVIPSQILQGMHEILAPFLFVLHCDHQALLHVSNQLSSVE